MSLGIRCRAALASNPPTSLHPASMALESGASRAAYEPNPPRERRQRGSSALEPIR